LAESARFANEALEIFVIDNGSKDQTLQIVETLQRDLPIEIIRFSENKGTTYPRNVGIQKAKGEYILILDSDVELHKESLAALLGELRRHSRAGIVCPKLIYPDGSLQYSYKRFPTLITKILKKLGSKSAFFARFAAQDELYGVQEKLFYPDYTISACWCMRKELFDHVGLLDEHIFYAPEDVDFCLRTWLSGYEILYIPEASGTHHTQRLSYTNEAIARSHVEGLIYYFKKHHYWFSRKSIYARISRAIGKKYPLV
jgi:GT2 family glycosyltransferase